MKQIAFMSERLAPKNLTSFSFSLIMAIMVQLFQPEIMVPACKGEVYLSPAKLLGFFCCCNVQMVTWQKKKHNMRQWAHKIYISESPEDANHIIFQVTNWSSQWQLFLLNIFIISIKHWLIVFCFFFLTCAMSVFHLWLLKTETTWAGFGDDETFHPLLPDLCPLRGNPRPLCGLDKVFGDDFVLAQPPDAALHHPQGLLKPAVQR